MTTMQRLGLGFGISLLGALVAGLLSLPLPWLLGPLLATAATRMRGVHSVCPRAIRYAGQWVIGISLGLYFTPEVAKHVIDNVGLVIFSVVYAIFLGVIGSYVLCRFAGLDFTSAWFAAAIGGASEMTTQGERHGAASDKVASVHSLRVLLVVVIIPFAFQWWMMGKSVPAPVVARAVDPAGLLWLALGSCAFAMVFRRLRLPSAWVLGPMAFAMALTVQEIHLSSLPQAVSWLGQLMIGWSLGDRYRPDFFKAAPRLLGVVAVLTLFMLALSALLAYMLAVFSGLPAPTLILGMAPGGIAEMAITAKVLGLGVPLVTAIHVVRMIAVVLLTTPLYRVLAGRFASGEKPRKHD